MYTSAKNTAFYTNPTLNCRGKLLDLTTPKVMGIINTTPDSFFDGGVYAQVDSGLQHAERLLQEGADIIDVGGMSTRPGAKAVSVEEELQRTIPLIEQLSRHFPQAIISIDTVKAQVAKEAIGAGAHLVNDISAGTMDEQLLATVAELKVPYILMHMQGQPDSMQQNPQYNDIVGEVGDFFMEKVHQLRALGVVDIVLDPGFGFGKTVEHNYQLLKQLKQFEYLGLPLLVGLSRKSMVCKVLKVNPKDALTGTIALNMVALQNGAKLLRVHDVKEAVQTISLYQQLEAA